MKVHLINPSDTAFGTAVITPRWLFVLAAATPPEFGDPILWDETVRHVDVNSVRPGDVVGIGIHTRNALRGYSVGRFLKERGAFVIFGGIHATLYPDEPFEYGGADCVVRGDGDLAWGHALEDHRKGQTNRVYEGGRVEGNTFKAARWDLLKPLRLHVGLCPDGPWMRKALLILLSMAHRWSASSPTAVRLRG